MEWNFEQNEPIEADVSLSAGLVEVRSAGARGVTVCLEAMGLETGRAQELIEASEVSLEGGKLRVHVPSRRRFASTEIRCTLAMAEGSSVSVKTASADVDCSIPLEELSAKTASGDVDVSQAGIVSFSSASGDFRSAEVERSLRAKTASGDVSVQRMRGDAEISAASGDVEVGELAGSLRASSASGDVKVGRAEKGRISANTASGDVSIGVAAGTGAHFDATSVSGEMTSALPVQESSPEAASLELTCRTVSGDIWIGASAS